MRFTVGVGKAFHHGAQGGTTRAGTLPNSAIGSSSKVAVAVPNSTPPWEGRVLEIEVTTESGHTLCRPVGELDAYTVGQFRESLSSVATVSRLLIDLSEVPFMDSAGLGALIGGIRRVREAGGEVAVACSRPTLTRLLHTTGFDRIVPVTETVEDASAALHDGADGAEDGES